MARAHLLLLVSASLTLLACNRASEPESSADASPDTRAQGTAARPATRQPPGARPGGPRPGDAPPPGAGPAEVVWDAPAAWPKADNPSPMRKATYKIPRAAGDAEDGELSVSQAGGTIDQNLARWAGQFDQKLADVKRQERTVNGIKVTVVEIHGAYKGMAMPGAPAAAPKAGEALLGAIAATSPPTFFKLTGPEKTVVGAQRDFDRFVGSLHAK